MYLYLMEFLGKPLYFFILSVAFADGQREVDISVNGDNVVKTNIGSYTIYETNQFKRTLTISCLSFLPVTSKISLVRNGTILNATFADSTYTNRSNIAITKFTFNRDNVTYLVGAYSCRFNSSLPTYIGTQFEYYIEREIQIYATSNEQGCASSVGSLGYFGEKVTFYCADLDHSLRVNFFQGQRLISRYSLQVILLQSNTSSQCIHEKTEGIVCLHDFMVHPSLEMEILPKNSTLDSHVMEFSCNSIPPRILYWELIRDDDSIFDLHNDNWRLQGGGNITIKQKAGWSSLLMENTDPGIRKVVCYAYGTITRAIVHATIDPIPETTTTTTTTKTSSVSLFTSPPRTGSPTSKSDTETSATTEMSTHSPSETTGEKKTIDCAPDSVTGGWFALISNGEWTVCIFVIASCEALLLLIIAGVLTYRKCRRGTKESSSKTQFTGDIVSSDTELHDNPVYMSYDNS